MDPSLLRIVLFLLAGDLLSAPYYQGVCQGLIIGARSTLPPHLIGFRKVKKHYCKVPQLEKQIVTPCTVTPKLYCL